MSADFLLLLQSFMAFVLRFEGEKNGMVSLIFC